MGKKQTNGGPWVVGSCLLSHILWCSFFADFLMAWVSFLMVFGHHPRKLLETMGGNTAQPRLENRISKQVSAWPLKFVFESKSSNTCLVQQDFFKNMTFLAWSHIIPCIKWQSGIILYSPLIKGSAILNWNESKVIFKETAVQSSFSGKSVFFAILKETCCAKFLERSTVMHCL